jgi:hypothetical protein
MSSKTGLSVSCVGVALTHSVNLTHKNIVKTITSSVSECECVRLNLTHCNMLNLLDVFKCVKCVPYRVSVCLTHSPIWKGFFPVRREINAS